MKNKSDLLYVVGEEQLGLEPITIEEVISCMNTLRVLFDTVRHSS